MFGEFPVFIFLLGGIVSGAKSVGEI
jgi:hypothetical protein